MIQEHALSRFLTSVLQHELQIDFSPPGTARGIILETDTQCFGSDTSSFDPHQLPATSKTDSPAIAEHVLADTDASKFNLELETIDQLDKDA
jgi:hypothetical protein